MAYNVFGGLVKISGNHWAEYKAKKDANFGGIIFASIQDTSKDGDVDHSGNYILANGIEYKVQDAAAFDELKAQFEAYVLAADASIDRLDSSVSGLETWKAALVLAAADNKITLNGVDGSVAFAGSNYVAVSTADNTISISIDSSVQHSNNETAEGDAFLVTKKYVADQIANLESALEFRGSLDSSADAESKLTTAATSKGDTYVGNSAEAFVYNGHTIESGDMVIVKADSAAGTVSDIMVIERSQTGVVTNGTAEGGKLTADKIVLGNGNDSVKASTIGVGGEILATTPNASTLATEAAVKDLVDNTGITAAVKDGSNYIDASVDATDNKKINITLDVATSIEDAEEGQLADAKQVKEYVDAAGGKLDAESKTTDESVKLNLTSASAAEGTKGDLGVVVVKSEDSSLLKVNIVDGSISLDLAVATLADASNGSTGLALAEDVHQVIIDNEKVTATAFNAIKDSVGLEQGLDVSWGTTFAANKSVVDAVKDLSTDLAAKVAKATVDSFGGKTGDILIQGSSTDGEVNLVMDGSTLKANVVNLDKVISAAIDSSIKDLDVTNTELQGKVLVGVSETDGKVASTARGVVVNGNAMTVATTDGSLSVTIDGADVLVGGESAHKDSSVAKAIADLSTAIDNISGDAIKSVVGESKTLKNENGDYVKVAATEDQEGNVTLNSSVQLADASTRVDEGDAFTATGLATDAYVQTAIANALVWEVIN